jgi:poly-gamma-glutamate synthesis protein (capsule biosynthesis protein)
MMSLQGSRNLFLSYLFIAILILSLSLGCQNITHEVVRATPTSTRAPLVLPSDTPIPSADPFLPTPEATFVATKTQTPEPTPPVILSVPDFLSSTIAVALQKYSVEDGSGQIIINQSERQADLQLVPGNEGIHAGSRSVALTVPFTSAVESVTADEAKQILRDGHPLVETIEWSEMPLDRKALRVDGLLPHQEGYPIRIDWSLVTSSGFEEIAIKLAPFIQERINKENIVQLSAVGDIMLDRALGQAIRQGNIEFPFALVTDQLSSADITLGNLESALGNVGQPADKSYTFRAPPEAAESLALAGFDVLSLANNHALDYGVEALFQAMDLLKEQSIATIGAGASENAARKPLVLEVNGLTLAFLAYTDVPVEVLGFDTRQWEASKNRPGLLWAELPIVEADVRQARQDADLVIVMLHSGLEYIEAPSPQQTAISRAAINAGADLVIGHHAHVLQGVEFFDTGVIVHGLGNFAFEIDGRPETAILNVWLDEHGVRQIEFVPAVIQFGGQPKIANELERTSILHQIYRLTDILNSGA